MIHGTIIVQGHGGGFYAKICKQMSRPLITRNFLTGALVLACALTCQAMSLGRTKGAIWIGRPLDITVQVKLDPGEDAASLCLAVDVLYADTRVNAGQVRVFVEPGGSREEAVLRIQSAVPVDEPVVNLYLKAGCAQPVTRRYVLLADVPIDYRADVVAPGHRAGSVMAPAGRAGESNPPVTAGGGDVPRSAAQGRRAAGTAARSGDSASSGLAQPAALAPAANQPAPVRSVVRKPVPEKPVAKARLKLDPADLVIERDPVLRMSSDLLSAPQDGGTRRAEAVALWRAINATPEEILKDAQRLQSLQTDAAALRGQNQKSQAEIAELRTQLHVANSERVDRGWVFGLAAALLAALGAAVYFWLRGREQSRRQWWSLGEESAHSKPASMSEPEASEPAAAVPTVARTGEVDIDLSAAASMGTASPVRPVPPPMLAPLDAVDFQTSLTGAGRAVKVEELLDIQQQADFFISLGQYEQAVATLRNHIADNVETSALAYLDLLKIYHLQGREKDYALVRKEFNDVFNAEVPEFAAFGQQTRGLQSYQSALSRITALWPTPKVLDVIEESIFRKPGQGSQTFDLEAYRELLMLYAVAKELVDDGRQARAVAVPGSPVPAVPELKPLTDRGGERDRPDFQSTNIQPLPVASLSGERGGDSLSQSLLRVPPSPNLGLDIDLSELVPTPVSAPAQNSHVEGHGKTSEPKAPDSHLIDFDLFDMATKAHASSKRGKP